MNVSIPFLLLLILLASPVRSETYSFSTFQYEPWSFVKNNNVSGIIPDIANAIAKEAALAIEIEIVPYSRMVNDLKNGSADFSILSRNSNNDDFVTYINKVFTLNVILLTRNGTTIKSLNSLYERQNIKSIGVLRGASTSLEDIDDERITIIKINNVSQGLKMLNAKRIDAFLTIEATSLYESKKLGMSSAFEFPGYKIEIREAWLQVSKKSRYGSELPYEAISAAVEKMKAEGEINRIIEKYLGGIKSNQVFMIDSEE
jgi:polar amino acid transport system substrate-binding protein